MAHSSLPDQLLTEKEIENPSNIRECFDKQKEFFETQKTKDVNFRIEQLRILKKAIMAYEDRISEAMYKDLKRSKPMTYYSEVGLSLQSITKIIKSLKKWTKPKRVGTSHNLFPLSSSWIQYEPLGSVLVISPWNYPITLTLGPLTAALSAGNCAILKPSEITPNVSRVISDMIGEYFDKEYIAVFQGDAKIAGELLELPFDHILYTGGKDIGKIVMEAAAKNLTPVTLELGGKSPAIIDSKIDVIKSAKRVVFGKFLNCGQTCVAPDYLFLHEDIADRFIIELKKWITIFYGENPNESQDYGRIINQRHFSRLAKYLVDGKIIFGGNIMEDELYISPTLMIEVKDDAPVMNEEIFGPILPIMTYSNIDDVIEFITKKPKPLALYLFTNNSTLQQKVLTETSSGGVAINDSVVQFACENLPFGGVGESGIGRYHGKYGFETFSHHKAVLKQTNLFDLSIKYPPFSEISIKLFRKLLK